MEFKFETIYNQSAFTEMARTLRKTVQKQRSRRSHGFGWIFVVLALFLAFHPGEDGFTLDFRTIVTIVVAVVLIVVLIWEDSLNGYLARKRILPAMEKAISTFAEDGYSSETEIGKTEWVYENVAALAESERYFVFIFSPNHAQLYDKTTISGGTVEEFRIFIETKTGKTIQKVK